ncbi:MAG TPA: polyprenol phosphomannose-dependent alpha 1,6 mannosyltransferase MptB [Actinomycetales bacterium]|nr:polyprenol phosphomannose-dependent alpha 1,6 mannosyltransferase MptB [Actinomycetales bacterium]
MRPGAHALARWALGLALLSAVLLLGTAALGPSAAEPPLGTDAGWRAVLPPYSLDAAPSSGLVSLLLSLGYVIGGCAVALGLWTARRGERVPRRAWSVAAGLAVLAVLVPPLGSADHVNYAAYGRIAVAGGDPYVEAPVHWAGGTDPVTSAVEAPWTTTPSIYGPVATLVQAVTSLAGGDSLRTTVWAWQLVCLAAWLAVGAMLRRHGAEPSRVAWLWSLNPVLGGVLLLGAHVDLLAAALALGAVLLCVRRPLVAGALLGAAVGVKLTCVLLGPAVLWALWQRRLHAAGSPAGTPAEPWWRPAVRGVVGAALVLVPMMVWAGPHVLDQLLRARRFVSLATPWRPLVDALTGPLPNDLVRVGVGLLTPLVVLAVAVLLARLLPRPVPPEPVAEAARASVVLAGAYVLAAPYSLPWYDALAWAPLALVGASAVDVLLLLRLSAYALAYVPGRVLGMTERVQTLTLGFRREVVPWVGWAVLLALILLARARPRAGADVAPRGS